MRGNRASERCPKCRKLGIWGWPDEWRGYRKGTLVLWCNWCDAVVNSIDTYANPFRDERAI